MARIRTIKPEMPHDEALARVSRDARLTFVYLLTVADDSGYFRANLKYLVGVLFPLDRDVTETLLKGWLKELTKAGRLEWRQLKDGQSVGYIVNFTKHQRIDHPSRSYFADNLATVSRGSREGLAKGVSESLSLESLSPESTGKALVELRSTLPDTADVEAKTQERKTKEAALRLGAEVVFSYWRAKMGKARAVLDKKRENRLVARLRENGGDVSELLYAVDGALKDDFIMGRDDHATRAYNGIETVFRDRAQVERFASSVKQSGQHPFLGEQTDG